jgi:roadblock/LC7 domain-containing protein
MHMLPVKAGPSLDDEGALTAGTYDDNPMLNLIVYKDEFPDGQVKEYAANIIAENMLTQVDSDGYSTTILKAIINYCKDEAVAVPKHLQTQFWHPAIAMSFCTHSSAICIQSYGKFMVQLWHIFA